MFSLTKFLYIDYVAEMVSMEKPDARAVMTYVSSYYHAFTSSQKVYFFYKFHFSAVILLSYFR